MLIKNIIFDFGGVLINDRSDDPVLQEIINKLTEKDRQKHKEILIKSELGQIPYDDVWESDKQVLFPNKSVQEIKDFFLNTEIYQPYYLAEKLLPNYKIIIFSNNHTGAPEIVAKNLNINISQFTFINSALIGLRKPNKEFYNYLIKKHNLVPEESIFIDNTLKNLEPATALGINVFHYKRNDKELIEFLRNLNIKI